MLYALALFASLFSTSAHADNTTWSCMRQGNLVNYNQATAARPLCSNVLTFSATCTGVDLVFSWGIISTSTGGALGSWQVKPWEPQDIGIVAITITRISGPSINLHVGSTFSGDFLLDVPAGQQSATSVWTAVDGAWPFPNKNTAPAGTYLDLHSDPCPSGSAVSLVMTVTYTPLGSVPPPPPPPDSLAGNWSSPIALYRIMNGTGQLYGGAPFTLAGDATISGAMIHASLVTVPGQAHVEIWTDDSGHPGQQLAVSAAQPVNIVNDYSFPISATLSAGTYWFIIVNNAPANNISWQTVSSTVFPSSRASTAPGLGGQTLVNGEQWRFSIF